MNPLLKLLQPKKEQTVKLATDTLISLGFNAKALSYDPDRFLLTHGQQEIFLGNLHDVCRFSWPWQRRDTARRFLAPFAEQPERPNTLDAASANLLPGLRDAWMFGAMALDAKIQGTPTPRPAGRPLGSRLWVGVFLDYPTSTSLVTEKDLEEWGASFDDCLSVATRNLVARSRGGFEQIAPGVYHSPWQDVYDPARLLCPELLGPLQLHGDPVAIAPNWNHLLVVGADDSAALAACIGIASNIMTEEPRPMSGLPIVRRGTQWVDLVLPRGHAAEDVLRKSRVLEMSSIYNEQLALIEKLHKKEGTDTYVAKYTGTRHEENGQYDSYAVWSKGVVTLLPHAERVSFVDADQPDGRKVAGTIDWDIVQLHCASLMKDAGYVPARFLVESFPTEQQLKGMNSAQALRQASRRGGSE